MSLIGIKEFEEFLIIVLNVDFCIGDKTWYIIGVITGDDFGVMIGDDLGSEVTGVITGDILVVRLGVHIDSS